VVSKTLNFFDDMCAVPQMSAPSSASASASAFCDHKARGAIGSSIKKHPHLLTREYTVSDDTTTSPSMRSETTGQSSVDHTASTSAVKKDGSNSNSKQNGGIPRSLSHEHENFEVVLDPASLLKEEKAVKPAKQTRAKRWPRLSKSRASSLSSSSQKKEKQKEQTSNKSNRNRRKSGTDIAATQESKPSPSTQASPSPLSARSRSLEVAQSPLQNTRCGDEMPLDEEIGHLVEIAETEQRQTQHVPEEGLAATADVIPEANTDKEQKSSGIGSVGPKVLAKKIWEKAKKIPVRHGEKKNQQHHRAEVDNEAAIARRSSELNKSLEEQDFLQQGCPKQDVEPILEENESDFFDVDCDDIGKSNEEKHASSMTNTWNNIFSSITNTLDPELSGGDPRSAGPNATASLFNTSADNSNLSSSIEGYDEADVDDASDSSSVREDQQKRLLSKGRATESVEVSHAKKKNSMSKTASLGHRLKKIQKSAYFKNSKKGSKKLKAKSTQQSQKATENETAQASSGAKSIVPTAAPFPPKLVWKSAVDPNSGRTYYYHRKTRETTWNKPEELTQYEIEYNKWCDTASFNEAIQGVVAAEADNTEETKEEEKASISIRSSSWPKAGLNSEAATDEETMDTPISRTCSHPVKGCGMIPLRMPDTTVSRVEETNTSVPKTQTKVDTNLEESNIGATQVEETKTMQEKDQKKQQPFDESSKPFDESTPFDEPLADTEPGLLFLPRSPKRFGRTMTYMSKASARSALTDRTEKIKNTGKGKLSAINAITENMSAGTSISSYTDNARFERGVSPSPRIPSRVPVVRERQLMVEELTDSRINAESYEGKAGEKRGRIMKGRARQNVEIAQDSLYDGDNDITEDFGASTFDNDTYGTDSVSALSENDTDFLSRRDNFDQARRRALDAAIDIEDWDLAAALSDGMRAANLPGGYEKAHSSWNQSSLDKFIANNDWTAVKSYIARMRVESKKGQGQVSTTRRKSHTSSANKRVGSRSQIQHRDMMSESSWSGSESESSYETYDSESQI